MDSQDAALAIGAVSAAGAAVAAIAAATQAWISARTARLDRSVQIWLSLSEEWSSEPMRYARRGAVIGLRARYTGDHNSVKVLDFLDGLGYLVRRRLLNKELAWHSFDYWVQRYVASARPIIAAAQQVDEQQWKDVTWLAKDLRQFAIRRGLDSGPRPEMDLEDFYEDEIALVPPFRGRIPPS